MKDLLYVFNTTLTTDKFLVLLWHLFILKHIILNTIDYTCKSNVTPNPKGFISDNLSMQNQINETPGILNL